MRVKKILLCLCLLIGMSLPNTTTFASNQPYYIMVNVEQCIVTIYAQDGAGMHTIPIKAFYGSSGGFTPLGTYHTPEKYEWRALFGGVYGQYATRITGSILFHSVPYERMDKSTLNASMYNQLGTVASAGCIRLTVEDAKWIYDNCPIGTPVTLYKSSAPEPITPTAPMKLDINHAYSGWDPTDPDWRNPWHSILKTEEVVEEIEEEIVVEAEVSQNAYYDVIPMQPKPEEPEEIEVEEVLVIDMESEAYQTMWRTYEADLLQAKEQKTQQMNRFTNAIKQVTQNGAVSIVLLQSPAYLMEVMGNISKIEEFEIEEFEIEEFV